MYHIEEDPGYINNLAEDPDFQTIKTKLKETMENDLKAQGDQRMNGTIDVFESYSRI